jgi:hypothetical protein
MAVRAVHCKCSAEFGDLGKFASYVIACACENVFGECCSGHAMPAGCMMRVQNMCAYQAPELSCQASKAQAFDACCCFTLW